jgi:4'-phosphopantetheinyl transferase
LARAVRCLAWLRQADPSTSAIPERQTSLNFSADHSFRSSGREDAATLGVDDRAAAFRQPLETGQVDLWLVAPDEINAAQLSSYERLMSAEERARWCRFTVPQPRLRHLVARALLRTTLSRYADVSPIEWQFETNAFGRPHVAAPAAGKDLHFNLSHTDGLVALAVARGIDVGVDVENVTRPLEDLLGVAASLFAPAEVAALRDLDEPGRSAAFFAFWTLKEAYVKARGMGFSLALDGFAFDLSARHPRVAFNERCPDDAAIWQFRRYSPTPAHALSLAIPAAEHRLDVRLVWVIPHARLCFVGP